MKVLAKLLVIYTILMFCSALLFAQQNKRIWPDPVKINHIYILTDTLHEFYKIDKHNFKAVFGTPLKVKKAYDEINEKFYSNYIYAGGELNFVDPMLYMDIKARGWGVKFKTAKGFTKTLKVGDSISSLKYYFPNSWAIHGADGFSLAIATVKGIIVEAYISFATKNGYITRIIISEDDS